MAANSDITRQFRLFSELLLLHRQDERLSDHLAGAAYHIQHMDQQVADLNEAERRTHFRPAIPPLLKELDDTGSIQALDELIQLTPPGLFEMMRIKGLGGKKLAVLWHTAKIDNVEDLLNAARDNRLSKIPGFGRKTEQNIIAAIEAANSNAQRFHYADVADMADQLVIALQQVFATQQISLCGDIRRKSTTVDAIEIIAGVSPSAIKTERIKKFLTIKTSNKITTTGHTLDEIPFVIYHTTGKQFPYDLFLRTGNPAHVAKVQKKLKSITVYPSEEALYKKANLPYIVPELREDLAEWSYIKKPTPLITTDDIKGVVHNHTTYSDGVDTLEAFVKACIRKKYQYVVISDHSKNAHYAGGLKEDKMGVLVCRV